MRSLFKICVTACVLASLLRADAGAFTLVGTVTNGTTGGTDVTAKVTLMNLRAGMKIVKEITSTDGRFAIDGLDASVPMYLLRVEYKGVTYSQHLHQEGGDTATVACTVYDTTPEWDGVRITIPHFLFRPAEGRLQIEKIIDVTNDLSPPRTIVGERGRLNIRYPNDLTKINALFVSILGMPIQQDPLPTDEPNVFAVDYPIKPGTTRFATSFDVPYDQGAYTYVERLDYPIDGMTILTEDPAVTISSDQVTLTKATSHQGRPLYTTGVISKGTEMKLSISGSSGAEPDRPPHQVVVVPTAARGFAWPLVGFLSAVLLAAMAWAYTRTEKPGIDPAQLKKHEQQLLAQLVKLEELHKSGLIPDSMYPAYQSHRLALGNRALEVQRLLGEHGRASGKTRRKSPKKGKSTST